MSQTEVNAMNVAQRIAVAELKRRFQKEEACSRTNGAATRQELLPNSVAHGGRKFNVPKGEEPDPSPASETMSFKERMQQFNQSPPVAKKAGLPVQSPKKNENSPRVVSAISKMASEDAESATSQEGGAPGVGEPSGKKIKPAVASRANAKSPLPPRACLSPSKKANGHGVNNDADRARIPTPDAMDFQEDGPGVTLGTTKIRPNPSHLSSLISEIQQQQQFAQNKQGTAKAKVSSSSSSSLVDGGSPPPALPPVPPVPPPRVPAIGSPALPHHVRMISAELKGSLPRSVVTPHPKWRRKPLPGLAQLGPPPAKPKRPPKVRVSGVNSAEQGQTPPLPQRNPTRSNSATSALHLRSNKPVPSLPVVPSNADQRRNFSMPSRQISRDSAGPLPSSSPIPEYTEEEEFAELDSPDELYDDTGPHTASSIISTTTSSNRTSLTLQADELYQDASLQQFDDCGELYEDVGTAEAISNEQGSMIYAAKKEEDRKKKEHERKLKKQQKEIEKRQKDIEKQNKKFNLTGTEVAVEMGVIKEATKSWRKDDLSVRKGETISILRISETPVGKWLVKNEEGKVGYVDLTNIEVDANSIRYPIALQQQALAHVAKQGPLPDKLQSWLSKLTPCVRQVSMD